MRMTTMKIRMRTPERVVRKVREGERMLDSGSGLSEVLRHLEITEVMEAKVSSTGCSVAAGLYALVVPHDLTPPELPTAYIIAVLSAYRGEEISAARALGLLLNTRNEHDLSDLPDLPCLPQEAIRSYVS